MIIRNIKRCLRSINIMESNLSLEEYAYSQTTSRPKNKSNISLMQPLIPKINRANRIIPRKLCIIK